MPPVIERIAVAVGAAVRQGMLLLLCLALIPAGAVWQSEPSPGQTQSVECDEGQREGSNTEAKILLEVFGGNRTSRSPHAHSGAHARSSVGATLAAFRRPRSALLPVQPGALTPPPLRC